jgi:hypothetical protein
MPALFLPAVGCAPGKSPVSGTVTLDGKPVNAGTIVFVPAKGAAVSAQIQDGKYSAENVPQGDLKVSVDNRDIKIAVEEAQKFKRPGTGKETPSRLGPGAKIPANPSMPPEAKAAMEKQQHEMAESAKQTKEMIAKYRPIPEKYWDPNTSGLTCKVGKGPNTFDVPLSSR